MPKERFHIYLAERLVRECEFRPPISLDRAAFFLGAVSPDIFYYDLPLFSLSPLGDWIHCLLDRCGIGIIFDWIAKRPIDAANGPAISWGLGLACHFLVDALWHPLIEELSAAGLGEVYRGAERLSLIERHRLIESEIEAFWLPKTSGDRLSDSVSLDFGGKWDRLLATASHYRSFLEFAGFAGQGGFSSAPVPGAGLSRGRIAWCLLCQNFFLKLFANRTLGGKRDQLLSFGPTRFLGALLAPAHPMLPVLFARSMAENRNPFSDAFMQRAVGCLKAD